MTRAGEDGPGWTPATVGSAHDVPVPPSKDNRTSAERVVTPP